MHLDWNKPGYPPQHYALVRAASRAEGATLVIAGCVLLSVLGGTLYGSVPAGISALAIAIFIFVLTSCASVIWDVCWRAQIHPYFQQRLGDIDTFTAGKALAKYLQQLDMAAGHLGVQPLSSFGFHDDLRGEVLKWHPAADGLRTIEALLTWLPKEQMATATREALLADLAKWHHALQRATSKQVPFCILLRHLSVTSGHEWDVRRGSAF